MISMIVKWLRSHLQEVTLLSHHFSVFFLSFFCFWCATGVLFCPDFPLSTVPLQLCSNHSRPFTTQLPAVEISTFSPAAPPPHQCKCFHLLAHLYAPSLRSLRSLPDCLCFHAGSTHLFLLWYRTKFPPTFRLWPSNTSSLLSLSASGTLTPAKFRLLSLGQDSHPTLTWTTVQPVWHWVRCVSREPQSFVEPVEKLWTGSCSHMMSVLSTDILKKTSLISCILTKAVWK